MQKKVLQVFTIEVSSYHGYYCLPALVSCFCFFWIPMLLVYGHYHFSNLPVLGPFSDGRFWRLKTIPAQKGLAKPIVVCFQWGYKQVDCMCFILSPDCLNHLLFLKIVDLPQQVKACLIMIMPSRLDRWHCKISITIWQGMTAWCSTHTTNRQKNVNKSVTD